MGFFSDLKEDLSQAVNELKTEDERLKKEKEAAAAETEERQGAVAAADETPADYDGLSTPGDPLMEELLAQMLDKVEETGLQEEERKEI